MRTNRTHITNAFSVLDALAKKAGREGKLLIFVYYSGHGTIDPNTFLTCGHILDGEAFDLESEVIALKSRANTTVIGMLDCCRQQRKGFNTTPRVDKVAGQMSLIHAVGIGDSAIAPRGPQAISHATSQFLRAVKLSNETFPKCLESKLASSLFITNSLSYQVVLKLGTSLSSNSKNFEDYSTEELLSWLSQFKLESVDYALKIQTGKYRGYHFKMFYTEQSMQIFQKIFSCESDIDVVFIQLGKLCGV